MMIRALAIATVALSSATSPLAAPVEHHAPTEGTIFSFVVRPDSSRTDVLLGLTGEVTLNHFTLRSPDRIVVDISNAKLATASGQSAAGAPGSGIVRILAAQNRASVVRVVLNMDAPHRYSVAREAQAIRISVAGSGASLPVSQPVVPAALAQVSPLAAAAPTSGPVRITPAVADPVQAKAMPPVDEFSMGVWRSGTRLAAGKQVTQQRNITVNFDARPITEVIQFFADYTGRTIIPTKDVTATVTASIKEQRWDVALKAILNAYGFDAREDPVTGIIFVDSYANLKTEVAQQNLGSRTFRLNYTNAAAVVPALTARLSRDCPVLAAPNATANANATTPPAAPAAVPGGGGNCAPRGSVTSDTLTNSVSVLDVPTNLDELEAYAKELDIRQPQVNIKAKIILVDRTSLEGLGIRYDLGSQNQFFNDVVPRQDSTGATIGGTGQIALGGNAISAIANATARIPSAALQLAYSTALGAFDFTAFIEALQTTSLLDVQAEPNGTTTNNRALKLVAGSQVPIRVVDAGSAAGTSSAARAQVRLQQTGIILEVTPHVTNDRHIQMQVHVENSNVTFSGGDATEFPTQSVVTEMLVADGETRVIGGLTQTTVTSTRTGIPLLVDLPVIGRLFGVTQRQETKRDLLILITPYILDPVAPPGRDH